MTDIKNIEQKTTLKTTATKDSGLELSLSSLITLFVLLLISVLVYNAAKTDLIGLPPILVLLTGFASSFIIFGILQVQVLLRLRAVRLAIKLTADLKHEVELRERQKTLLEAILRNVGNAIIVVDMNQKIVLMNKVAEEYTAQTDKSSDNKLISTVLTLSLNHKEYNTLEKAVDHVLKTKEEFEIFPFGTLSAQGSADIPVRGTIEIIDKGGGNVVGAVISLMDISKELSLEQEKDDFISMAAHQFKTPATGLKWQIEMITGGDFGKIPDQLNEPISEVSALTKNIINLVNDFLQISRISQKRVTDNPELVKVSEMVKQIIAEVESISAAKGVIVSVELDDESHLEIEIDKKRFHDVIENLVSNAIKYNKQGGTVTIKLEQLKDNFTLTVCDTGIGIPKADQEKIFTRFFRAGNAVKSKNEGTGLGLYMIKSYIDAWGGTISISSEENKGTKVSATLPMRPANHVLDKNLMSQDEKKKPDVQVTKKTV